MITSIVGRLIKKPEVAERIQIPGKRIVNFTVVENRTRGERRLAVFFNLSMVVGTDAQFDLVMRFEKGTVLLFSSPRITYVRQSERSETEQTINLYAEADNFKIVAGAGVETAFAPGANGGTGAGVGGGELFEPPDDEAEVAPALRAGRTSPPAPSAVNRSAPRAQDEAAGALEAAELDELDEDPFPGNEPDRAREAATRPPARPASPAPARLAPASGQQPASRQPPQPQPSRRPSGNAAPPSSSGTSTSASAAKNRRPTPAPVDEEFSDLEDPFADSEL